VTPGSAQAAGSASSRRRDETVLTLVRHGETDWNRELRIQGSTDVPLNDVGIAQARAAGQGLAGSGYAAVYSSPQSRALETARMIAAAIGTPSPVVYDDLRERSFGPAEGMTGPAIAAAFTDGIPDQETRDAVVERALPVLEEIARRHRGEAVIVVTHGAVISSIVRRVSDNALPAAGEPILNLSLSHFTHAGEVLRLREFNVPSHDPELLTLDVVSAAAPPAHDSAAAGPASPATSRSTSSSAAADPAQV